MSCHASKVIAVGARPPCHSCSGRWRAYGNAIGRARHNIQHAFLVRERGSVLLAMRTEAPLEACSQWKIRPDAAGSDERPASRLRGHPLPQAFCLPCYLASPARACIQSSNSLPETFLRPIGVCLGSPVQTACVPWLFCALVR